MFSIWLLALSLDTRSKIVGAVYTLAVFNPPDGIPPNYRHDVHTLTDSDGEVDLVCN